MPALEAKIW